jgi:hypothetical protein
MRQALDALRTARQRTSPGTPCHEKEAAFLRSLTKWSIAARQRGICRRLVGAPTFLAARLALD